MFRKRRPGAPPDYFRWEASGLRWLQRAAGGCGVPAVLDVGRDQLTIERITPAAGAADAAAAARFGGELAATHAAGADAFGAAPAGWWPDHTGGFIADLPLPLGAWDAFGPFYADARIEPYLRLLGPLGGLVGGVRRAGVFDDLMAALRDPASGIAGPPCAPARLHGDLWSGNVVFGRRADGEPVRGWLIDPAAHGGHPETDLAMLALFGMPRLNDILAGYADSAPLAEGWRARVPLHQVHPLLVHAVLFGGGYLDQAVDAARAALRTAA